MAKKVRQSISEKFKDFFGKGKYETGVGGGTPMGEPEKTKGKYPDGGRGVWQKKYNSEPKRETGQPRTDDGKFTYNSVIGKPLKQISKSHGRSRGTTVPPILTGKKNGVHFTENPGKKTLDRTKGIQDKSTGKWYYVENTGKFQKSYVDHLRKENRTPEIESLIKKWKQSGDWFERGDRVALNPSTFKIKIAPANLMEFAQEYISSEEGFGFKNRKEGKVTENISTWATKTGKKAKDEGKAKKAGQIFEASKQYERGEVPTNFTQKLQMQKAREAFQKAKEEKRTGASTYTTNFDNWDPVIAKDEQFKKGYQDAIRHFLRETEISNSTDMEKKILALVNANRNKFSFFEDNEDFAKNGIKFKDIANSRLGNEIKDVIDSDGELQEELYKIVNNGGNF